MTGPVARVVTLLTQDDCALCDHAKGVVGRLAQEYPLRLEEVGLDTTEGRELAEKNMVLFAPGILLDGQPFGHGRLSEKKLRRALRR